MRKSVITMLIALLGVPAAVAVADEESAPAGRDLVGSSLGTHPLKTAQARKAAKAARRRAAARKAAAAVPPQLQAIAACESGGNPRAVSSSGPYRGKYQFSTATWQAVGGKGDPAAAPEAEQDKRAAILYARSGPGQWPVCAA